MGKYHNVLYVAAKLAFDWSLQDNYTVARLLDEIYSCEKTFERLFLGMIQLLFFYRWVYFSLNVKCKTMYEFCLKKTDES